MFYNKVYQPKKIREDPPEYKKMTIGPQYFNLRMEVQPNLPRPHPHENVYTMLDQDYNEENFNKKPIPVEIKHETEEKPPRPRLPYALVRARVRIRLVITKKAVIPPRFVNTVNTHTYWPLTPPHGSELGVYLSHELPTYIVTSKISPETNDYCWNRFFAESQRSRNMYKKKIIINDAEQNAKLNRVDDNRIFGEKQNWEENEFTEEFITPICQHHGAIIMGKNGVCDEPSCMPWSQYYVCVQAAYFLNISNAIHVTGRRRNKDRFLP